MAKSFLKNRCLCLSVINVVSFFFLKKNCITINDNKKQQNIKLFFSIFYDGGTFEKMFSIWLTSAYIYLPEYKCSTSVF